MLSFTLHGPGVVSIPLRKFRKDGYSATTGIASLVSIPLRKFRKQAEGYVPNNIFSKFPSL